MGSPASQAHRAPQRHRRHEPLERVARAASEALGHPVAIALPAVDNGVTVAYPAGAISPQLLHEIAEYAVALTRGEASDKPARVAELAPVRIDLDVVGIVATAPGPGAASREDSDAWLAAAATAAAVTALMRDARIGEVVAELETRGMSVASSVRRRAPEQLHEALCEAELLVELWSLAGETLSGQEETYRLLIGVLLRNPEELASLRAATISPLAAYDAEHKTELVATLEAFLAHDGSTTDTAEALGLHRHTVGYRLSRVQEVARLSPYESEGRERLSLGLKAHQLLEAAMRRSLRR